MRVSLPPTEPDACANDRWPEPARRAAAVVTLDHSGPRRISGLANVRRPASTVTRKASENSR